VVHEEAVTTSVSIPWQPGDFILIGNLITGHGRTPYSKLQRTIHASFRDASISASARSRSPARRAVTRPRASWVALRTSWRGGPAAGAALQPTARTHRGPVGAPPGVIAQVISQFGAPPMNIAISGGMLVAPPGEGWHVTNLVQISLRGPIVSGVCDTEATASACSIVVTSSKEVCLMGTGGPFDSLYGGTPAQQAQLTCWPNGNPASISGPLHTGLAAGFAEFYGIGNPENILDVSGVASGMYWLEAEVNPNGTYQEADTSNNIARVQVSL
jgi:hypothetical protein